MQWRTHEEGSEKAIFPMDFLRVAKKTFFCIENYCLFTHPSASWVRLGLSAPLPHLTQTPTLTPMALYSQLSKMKAVKLSCSHIKAVTSSHLAVNLLINGKSKGMQLVETKGGKTCSELCDASSPALCGGGRMLTSLCYQMVMFMIIWHAQHIVSPSMCLPSCPKEFHFLIPPHKHSFFLGDVLHYIYFHLCGFSLLLPHSAKISKLPVHSNSLKFLPHSPLNFFYFNYQTWFLCWKVASLQYFLIVKASIPDSPSNAASPTLKSFFLAPICVQPIFLPLPAVLEAAWQQ